MIQLLNYIQKDDKVTLNFEKSQWVDFHTFGKGIYTATSEGIGKESIIEIKDKLNKEGLYTNLDNFVGKYYYEYFEEK